MNFLLLTLSLAAPPEPDVLVVVSRGKDVLKIPLVIETANGLLGERQTKLLKDYPPSPDGSGLLDALVPDGKLLRTEIVPPSPHAEPITRALFDALDTNKDGKLSIEELTAAEKVLLTKFDSDGDDCITALEIVPDLLTRKLTRAKDVPRVDINYSLTASDKEVKAHIIPLLPQNELLANRGPLLSTISMRHANPVVIPQTPKSLLRPERQEDRSRFESVAKEICTLTVRVQPRCWFDVLDEDGDGQLSVRELRNAKSSLQNVSGPASARGDLFLPNFEKVDSVSISISPGSVTRPPVRLTKAPPPMAGPTWFCALDRNGDGDVSRREFPGTDTQFKHYDTDHDGLISLAEAEAGDAKLKKGK